MEIYQKKQLPVLQTAIKNIVHIILAAGSSNRMGHPKQLLPWKNKSLIVNEIEKSLQLEQVITIVVLGANFEIIKKEIKDFAVDIIYNQKWESGMGTSISCALQEALRKQQNFNGVLITLVDQPLIDKMYLESLISKFNQNQNSIVATTTGKKIGVPALFPNTYFSELIQLNDDYGARYVIKKYRDQVISMDGKDMTDDIDTIEEYKAMLERVKSNKKQYNI
ncbi:nucleotidyltransferase family protein [Aquimarina sp. 2201CG14-23]|uniref:nucleotidyltransferase family protein n=1 Tax=Aquimarina mycalae TaxID=3040073 RepID=UPI002477D85C|nr:nucleotidyltransferase family protein [Aquimarina sp. 2201CG14-23]MDH7446645.1 nucleotidyltransferase family protein [Aquimarina sp. 2201CG14-23]